ncbi:MAG: cofactor-independent phosphoglycerate mutase [Oscillospiraceae bacterium]|nr:cofactor-independent phosphoglycerate mutase [Oscillospiraceae bacterium]
MKHVILLYDGMADLPCDVLDGKTPMETADKPLFDAMGRDAEVGLVKTVPDGLKPGSDVANLSVLGYDPLQYYTGRSPLEAVSMGVPMGENDLTLRCNLVTLSDEPLFADKTMLDYAGADVTTQEAKELIESVQQAIGGGDFSYYAGVAYRHCLLWRGAKEQKQSLGTLTPPHDITGQKIAAKLPATDAGQVLLRMMEASVSVLEAHPVNKKRRAEGKRPANSIWLWGEGTYPALPSFESLRGKKGTVISAVDLLKGIGILAGMQTPDVQGATGWLDTNYEGKARCAVDAFKSGQDFVYLHMEATDECGHRGEARNKTRGIELIDKRVLPILLEYLDTLDDYALMILPDHPTPCSLMTHTRDAVPYMLFRKKYKGSGKGVVSVTEKSAAATGIFVQGGSLLMDRFLGK